MTALSTETAPITERRPWDTDTPVPRGPRDPYRDYPLTDEEYHALGLRPSDRDAIEFLASSRPVMRVFPGSRWAVEAVSALARLRGARMDAEDRAWAATDPLDTGVDHRLLGEIDAILRTVDEQVRAVWAPVAPTPLEPERLRRHLRLARLRRRAE